jgi:hypothetical protein
MKKSVAVLAILIMLAGIPAAFAGDGGEDKSAKYGLMEMICAKAHMIYENGEEVGLSAEVVQKAKDLKMQAKRFNVTKDAEIEMAALDVKEALYKKGDVDLKKVDALIDAKYALKAEKAKRLAAIYVELKTLATPEQWKDMKRVD